VALLIPSSYRTRSTARCQPPDRAPTGRRFLDSPVVLAREIGSGTPVVLLHGFGLDHRSLLPLDPAFEREGGWRRILLDLPGATGTPAAAVGTAQEVADAVVAEIRSRLGDERFAVLGASFGGMIARHVAHALRPQVLGLATVAGVFVAGHAERAVPPRTVLQREPAVEAVLGARTDEYREDAVVESVEDARGFLRFLAPGIDGADRAALERIAARYALDREPEDADPEPFAQPTLHITGRQDHVVGWADAWARLGHYPRAAFAVLDAAGHNLLFEQAEVCAALVGEWLRRMRPRA
jgi:pimeloyl-ACP methyl ester carboxylesterase